MKDPAISFIDRFTPPSTDFKTFQWPRDRPIDAHLSLTATSIVSRQRYLPSCTEGPDIGPLRESIVLQLIMQSTSSNNESVFDTTDGQPLPFATRPPQ